MSVSTDGINTGNSDSFSPAISANGRYVLFHSKASNLAAGSFGSGIENLFFRDMQTGTTYHSPRPVRALECTRRP